MGGKNAHTTQCSKSRALTKVTDLILEIESFEQQRVILKGLLQSDRLKKMLKPPYLLTQEFKYNKKAQEKLSKHMCNFGARAVRRNGRRAFRSYLDVNTINYQ